jgi:hypothetical protein
MNDLECNFCEKTFSSKANLKHHQQTAKYCLDKRNITNNNFLCEGCSKPFTTKAHLEIHNQTCNVITIITPYKNKIVDLENQIKTIRESTSKDISFYIKQLEKKDKLIEKLQDKLENVALKAVSRPTTTVNNNTTNVNAFIQQMDVITDQVFQDNLVNFTIDYIKKGVEGFANYALEHPLNNKIACVDFSRKKIKYKDENGTIISDPEMLTLSTKLFSSILVKNKQLITQYVEQVTYSSLNPEEKMQIMVDMSNYMFFVNRGADGEKHELYDDFIKNVCLKLKMNYL